MSANLKPLPIGMKIGTEKVVVDMGPKKVDIRYRNAVKAKCI